MDPNQISSGELPGLDFVHSLAETLAEYGVGEDEVYALGPGVLNFIKYLLTDIEDLEAEVIRLRERDTARDADLRRVQAQRIALLLEIRKLTGSLSGQDVSATTRRILAHAVEETGELRESE